jgi:3D-(3,5/4)-trihydroxycyclohexane-1,2-dione acylhydrolase (decyclizing)
MPGDLHKLWRTRDPKGYHVEYGYSCMGYEIPGGMGVKLAAPDREVYVLIGDGSYLMLPGELVTAVAQRIPIVIVLVDNHGYASIGALSRSVGSAGFGTHYRFSTNGALPLASTVAELRQALSTARGADGPVVVYIEVDRYKGVPSYESWWDVPVAEVSEEQSVRSARREYERAQAHHRQYLEAP